MILNFPDISSVVGLALAVTTETVELTAAASTNTTQTKEIAKPGYQTLGVVGFEYNHTDAVQLTHVETDSGNVLWVSIQNNTESAISVTFRAKVLWVKTS